MIEGPALRARLMQLSRDAFDTDLEQYLAGRGMSFWGLTIVEDNGYEPLFGDPPDKLLSAARARPVQSEAGYSVDVGSKLGIPVKGDVFMIRKTHLAHAGDALDSLLVHELAHMVVDSGMDYQWMLSYQDHSAADILQGAGRFEDREDYYHGRSFCVVLAAGCRRLIARRGQGTAEVERFLKDAMRFDVPWDPY